MSKWLNLLHYIDTNFINKPRAITITSPNGTGKTTSICRIVSYMYGFNVFDRIIVVFPSHEISTKIINNLINFGASNIVHYVGIEKVCINKKLLEHVKKLGLNPSFACKKCPYNIFNVRKIHDFNERLRFSAKFLNNYFKSIDKVLDPSKFRPYDFTVGHNICLQALVKYVTIYPQLDNYFKSTIIILCPYALFASKPVIFAWRRFFKRQRAIRKYLAVFDECDHIIYSGFQYKITKPNFSNFDVKILKKYSTKSTKLFKYIEFYHNLYNILKGTASGNVSPEDCVSQVTGLIRKYSRIIKKVADLAPEISNEAYNNNEYTFIIQSVSEVLSIEYFTECMANSVEEVNDDIIIQDVDYAYRILYDVEFPFRYFWKLSTTATFPQPEIFRDSKLIDRGRESVEYVETIDVFPSNVSLFTFVLFPELFSEFTIESRNVLIEYKIDKVALLLKKSYKLYREITGTDPRGAIIFTGNKTQYSAIKDAFYQIIVEDRDGIFAIEYNNTKVYFTYCASRYARGLDFDILDISIVLAPLIRSPRQLMNLDSLDVARATAEAIQSAFRIVRSLRPERHKLLGFEANMILKKTYLQSFPTWFIKLLTYLSQVGQIYSIRLEL